MEGYSTILDEYLVTDHKQPLIVITNVNDAADDLLYKKAFELYGNRGYKMMTNTCNIDLNLILFLFLPKSMKVYATKILTLK